VAGPVTAEVEAYVAMRHGLGYRSVTQDRSLRAFARHVDRAGHDGPIPLEATLGWATASASTDPCNPATRLATVRGFLRHLAALDGATEVPAPGLLGSTGHRKTWHAEGVDVDTQIAALATYLGHVEVRDVYWYLSAVPELMGIVAARFEAFGGRSSSP